MISAHAAAEASSADPIKYERMRAAVRAYFRSISAGHTPTRWDLLCRYPDLADELEKFLADVRAGWNAGWRSGGGRFTSPSAFVPSP